jgi:hypothetical protein
MPTSTFALSLLLMVAGRPAVGLGGEAAPRQDPAKLSSPEFWEPVRFLLGEWQGTASGEPGTGTVSRRYELVLGNRFIHERSSSSYLPRQQGDSAEVHEHWSFLSYDRAQKLIRLRQFHQESFVISYRLNAEAGTPTKLVFESEEFENFDNAWRARETYEVVSDDEFVETFELAPPGKPFEVYSRNHFKRVE